MNKTVESILWTSCNNRAITPQKNHLGCIDYYPLNDIVRTIPALTLLNFATYNMGMVHPPLLQYVHT